MPLFRVRTREVMSREYMVTAKDSAEAEAIVEAGDAGDPDDESREELVIGDTEEIEDVA